MGKWDVKNDFASLISDSLGSVVCEPCFIQVHILDNESDISIKLKYFCKFSSSMNGDIFIILQKLVYAMKKANNSSLEYIKLIHFTLNSNTDTLSIRS